LFVERARQYRPHFDLQEQRARAVAEICVRLDGIPLALELAAARIAVLPIEQIVRLLDQRFRLLTSGNRELPRHQTLRAMIDWSYELLDAAEKALFARLSVFADGWTIAAAEAVCGGEPIAEDELVYVMIGLIEQSLVVADEDGDRYRMLETVREYAKGKLVPSGGAEAVGERHRDYFLALAEDAEPKLMGAEQGEWLRRLEAEHENLRAALEWSLAEAGSGGGLRLCWALRHFWRTRGHLSEGNQWCTKALGKAGSAARTPERARALAGAGVLDFALSDYPAARARHKESLAIRRQLGDGWGISASLSDLGNVALREGDAASARALYEESLAIKRQLGDRSGMAKILNNLGSAAIERGDRASARALFEESLAINRELGDRGEIAVLLGNLGVVASDQGDATSARTLYEESLAIMRELGDQNGVARLLTYLGRLAHSQGNFTAARALQEESLAMLREVGDRRMMAFALEGLAAADAALASSLRAAQIWGAAERLREHIGSPHSADERSVYDRRVAAARAALGDDVALDRAWQAGRALTLEQAIELALEKSIEQP
jgi:non-specific serine/threonine protein kinase